MDVVAINLCSNVLSLLFVCVEIFIFVRVLSIGTHVTRNILNNHGGSRTIKSKRGMPGQDMPPMQQAGFTATTITVAVFAGVGVYQFVKWMYVKRFKPDENDNIRPATAWETKVYTLLPLRVMSRVWGTLSNVDLPEFMRVKIFTLYVESFGVNLEECKNPDLASYKNLGEFFIRALKDECRPLDDHPNGMVSPADGTIMNFGKITSCQVEQVKGMTYSLQAFLGDQTWRERSPASRINTLSLSPDGISNLNDAQYLNGLKKNPENDLYQYVVYLAPGDYHRFHSPIGWSVIYRRHFQGMLLSVNPAIASWIRDLFCLQERVAYMGSWQHGFFSFSAVGATNVGTIKVQFDPSLETNRWSTKPRYRDLRLDCETAKKQTDTERSASPIDCVKSKGVSVKKGELFGEFRLGSTIVLIFEAPKHFQFVVKKNQKIKYGERIGVLA